MFEFRTIAKLCIKNNLKTDDHISIIIDILALKHLYHF
jgi:hypothetical protein